MQVPDALRMRARELHRIAAAVEVMTRVEADAQQRRICHREQARDFGWGLDARARVMMKDGPHADSKRGLGDAVDQARRTLPLLVMEALISRCASGTCHAPRIHLIRQYEKWRPGRGKQTRDLQRGLCSLLVAPSVSQRQRNERAK